MADNQLRVAIVADSSELSAGLNAATDQVVASATTMADAQQIATAATKNLAAAQEQLGASAARGSAQAIAIIKEYQAATVAATAQVDAFSGSVAASVAPLEAEAAAATGAAVATNTLGISATRTGGAIIGGLEGRMLSANRTAAAFLSTTLGLGPALMAAFPVIGALALLEVLVDIGREAVKAYDNFISIDSVWDKLTEDVLKMQGQDFINTHSLETAKARLDEVNTSAGNLRETAEQLHKTQMGDFLTQLASGNILAAGAAVAGLAVAHQAAVGTAVQVKQGIALTKEEIEDQHKLNDAQIEARFAGSAGLDQAQQKTAELAKQLAINKEEQSYEHRVDQLMGNKTPANAGDSLRQAQDQAARARAGAALSSQQADLEDKIAKATIEAAHAEDAMLPPAQRITAELQKQLSLNLQAQEASKTGRPESDVAVRRLQDEIALGKANAELSQREDEVITQWFETSQKDQEEAIKRKEEVDKVATEDYKRRHEEQISIERTDTEAIIQKTNEVFTAEEKQIKQQEEIGIISHKVADQRIADAIRVRQATITGALGKEQGLFDPALGLKELQEYTELQNKMDQEARKGAQQREQITMQEALKFVQEWKKATAQFNASFTSAFNEWITHSKTAGQAFGAMFGQMERQLIDFVAVWVLKQAEKWALTELAESGALVRLHILSAASNTAIIQGAAGTAAATAAAAAAAGGPPAMIAAAAAASAVVESVGSAGEMFEAGGIVAGRSGMPVPIQAHAGERVLSAGQTSKFESMVNSSQSSSRNTLNYNPQVTAIGDASFKKMLDSHADHLSGMMKKMVRPEAMA